ncbi:MAG: hypothetical protein RKE49_10865 [Oceanicaulis sp.]
MIALIISLQASPALEAFEAWRAGDLVMAGERARVAMATLERDGCSVTPDGAKLAYIIGFAAQFDLIDEPAPYWFWAAGRINRVAGGLEREQSSTERELASEPGREAWLDPYFAHSPYFDARLRAQECARRDHVMSDPPAGAGEAAYLIAEVRTGRDTAVRQATSIASYPRGEGDRLAQRLEGLHLVTGTRLRMTRAFVFNPCAELYDVNAEPVVVCRSP